MEISDMHFCYTVTLLAYGMLVINNHWINNALMPVHSLLLAYDCRYGVNRTATDPTIGN
jgi:hypothetical protein